LDVKPRDRVPGISNDWPIDDWYGKGYVEQGDIRFAGLNGAHSAHSRQGDRPIMGIRFMFQNWHTPCRARVSQPGIISPASRQSIFLRGIGQRSRIDVQAKPGQHPGGNQAMDIRSKRFSESGLAGQKCIQPPGFRLTMR
jgi:hypothetical protein